DGAHQDLRRPTLRLGSAGERRAVELRALQPVCRLDEGAHRVRMVVGERVDGPYRDARLLEPPDRGRVVAPPRRPEPRRELVAAPGELAERHGVERRDVEARVGGHRRPAYQTRHARRSRGRPARAATRAESAASVFWETTQRASRSEVAAHPVHPTARWRRCRADEEPWVGGGVRVEPGDGPREELPQIGDAARDRAADVIRIVRLEIPSAHDVAREDAVAEAGCEPLDLPLDGLGLILRRPVRYVTVRVAGVLAPRRPGGVELALLDDEDEGPRRMLAAPDGRLRGRDLVEGPAEVDGRRLEAAGIPPGDRPVERPVDLEGAGAVAIAPEAAHVPRGKDRFPDVGELRRTGVEQDDTRRRDVGEG